jgi:hypothetical protein
MTCEVLEKGSLICKLIRDSKIGKASTLRSTKTTLLLAILAAGCGGGTSASLSPNSPAIPASKVSSVVPTCASPLASGASEPCSVVVAGNGTFNKTVNWSASSGTISSAGILSAPSVTSITSIIVTATSVQDSVTGTVAVSVTPLSTPPPPPSVASLSVTCQSPIASGATSQCAVVVLPSGATQTVTWADSAGTISATGLLTAPTVTMNTVVTVTATSTADATKSGSFMVAVSAPTMPPVTAVTVMCAPMVQSNASDQCSASVSPSTVAQTVSWTATGGVSISSTGAFVAPVVTTNTDITVTATSTLDTTKSGMFKVTILAPAPPPPTGPENLGAGFAPSMLIDSNGAIDVAWQTTTGIQFRRSVDGGVTFSTAQLVIPQRVPADFVEIQVDSSNAIVIFSSYQGVDDPEPVTEIARSVDGANFKLFPVPSHGELPTMALEPSGAIDVAWFGSVKTLYAIRSTDGGATFSPAKTIWSTPDDTLDVEAVAGPHGQLYLFFGHEKHFTCDVLFSASLDGSQTFSTPKSISPNSPNCNSNALPQVDAAGNLNATWDDLNDILFAHSADQGQTFTVTTVVSKPFSTGETQFAVGPNGEIDLVFDSARDVAGFQTIDSFFTQSKDHGLTFSVPVKLNQLPYTHPPLTQFTGAVGPVVAVDATGKITAAWDDDALATISGWDDIYTSSSTDGVNFSDVVNLTNTPNEPETVSQVLVNSKGVRYFLWGDSFSAAFQNVNVFFDAVP